MPEDNKIKPSSYNTFYHITQFCRQDHSDKFIRTLFIGSLLFGSAYALCFFVGQENEKVQIVFSVLKFLFIAYGFVLYTLCFVGLVYYFTDESKKAPSERGGLDDKELIIAQTKYAFVALLVFYVYSCVLVVMFAGESPTGYMAMVGILLSMAIAFTGMTLGYQFHTLRDKVRREHELASSRKNHTLNLVLQSRLSSVYQEMLGKMYVHYPDHISVPNPEIDLMVNFIIQYGGTIASCSPSHKFFGIENAHLEKYDELLKNDSEGEQKYFLVTERAISLANSLSAIDFVLNHFEFLAAGLIKDDLYEPLLFECYAGIVKNLKKRTIDYVRFYRKDNDRPKTWILQESLAIRWTAMGNDFDKEMAKTGLEIVDSSGT